MTDTLTPAPQIDAVRTLAPTVEIVVPTYNEAADLERSVRRLHQYLERSFPFTWQITVADNASTDQTWAIAQRLAEELGGVCALHLDQKGRGRALSTAWTASRSPVVAYMDVDLSTDLDALLPLVAPLVSGHSHVAIGSRLARSARVVRGPKREAISRTYNLLLRATLRSSFSDAQCGFKALRRDAAEALLPLVEDKDWFFDTELLVLAEHNGLRIHEVPVDWVDDPDSRVDVARTARDDLKGICRMVGRFAHGDGDVDPTTIAASASASPPSSGDELASQLVRFASVGAVSTGLFALLFVALAGPIGATAATVLALGACTIANTAAHRRITFALRGRAGRARHHAGGLAVAALPLAMDLAVLGLLAGIGVSSTIGQLAVLTATNGIASLARFGLLRRWVFRLPPTRLFESLVGAEHVVSR